MLSDVDRMQRAVRSLRNKIRDKKQLNKLLNGAEESSDPELEQCLVEALIDWNTSPPHLTPVTLATHPNKPLLLECAALMALQSAGIWHSREHMPSSDGGTSADDHAKAGEYSGWIERMYQNYERKKADQKLSMNIAQALTGMSLPSEYSMTISMYGETW